VFVIAIVVGSVVLGAQLASKREPNDNGPNPTPSPSPQNPPQNGNPHQECFFQRPVEDEGSADWEYVYRNARIFDKRNDDKNLQDIHVVGRTIKAIGQNLQVGDNVKEKDLQGNVVTPGLIDMHSHAGVYAWPDSFGNDDGNEETNPTLPMVRAIDAFNPGDLAIPIMLRGGITTAQVLPGSGNIMGGQGVIMKMVPSNNVEEMRVKNAPVVLKMACGENPKKVYGRWREGEMPYTRMGSAWLMRKRFEEARAMLQLQNKFCANMTNLTEFPKSLELDNLVQLLRGYAILNVHCYKVEDMEMMIRISKEFDFSITTFHHALEAYKIPEILKENFIKVAIFSDLWGYKMEALEGSVWAPSILAERGIEVALKSDHPVINAKDLIVEAQIAHHFGMREADALAAVTTVPAKALRLEKRIGSLQVGYEADFVVWNKHPLQMAAKPFMVVVHGASAYEDNENPIRVPVTAPLAPEVIFPRAITEPPSMGPNLIPKPLLSLNTVNFVDQHVVDDYIIVNAREVYTLDENSNMVFRGGAFGNINVRVRGGIVTCVGSTAQCPSDRDLPTINLQGGVVAPGLINVNSLGVQEIDQESTSNDGTIGGSTAELANIVAANGIIYNSKHHYAAAAGGVLTSVTNPKSNTVVAGQSSAYFTIGANSLRSEADQVLISSRAALNLKIGQKFKQSDVTKSISGQVGHIRSLFLAAQQKIKQDDKPVNTSLNMEYFNGGDFSDEIVPEVDPFVRVLKGEIPVVFWTHQADQISSVLQLVRTFKIPKPILAGASEIHLVADQVKQLNVSVIFTPITCQPENFERVHCDNARNVMRIMKSYETKVALSIEDPDLVRRLRWEGGIFKAEYLLDDLVALRTVTSNIADMFGLPYGVGRIVPGTKANFVAYTADPLSYEGHIELVAVNNKVYFQPRQL
jgi:imidazolonepropionase-like amidohydrolase